MSSSISIFILDDFLALAQDWKGDLGARGQSEARKQSCVAQRSKKEKQTHSIWIGFNSHLGRLKSFPYGGFGKKHESIFLPELEKQV